jgi:hypothetical protein
MRGASSICDARDRILERAVPDSRTGCLLIGSSARYDPEIRVRGVRQAAHVVVWRATRQRRVGVGFAIARRCHRTNCVRREHLVRMRTLQAAAFRGPTPAGVTHYRAKLTAEDVREIRRGGGATDRELAERFRVTPSAIGNVRRGHTYSDVR